MTQAIRLFTAPPLMRIETEPDLALNPNCERCDLHRRCASVCVQPRGREGGVYLVGEHPGASEDQKNSPFVGKTGHYLEELVEKHLGRDYPVIYDNAVRCYPGREKVEDKHIDQCRPYLKRVLDRSKAKRIVAMGAKALQALTGRSPAVTAVRRGYSRLSDGRAVMFCLHPAAALYNDIVKEWFEEDLEWALKAEPTFPAPWGIEAYVVRTEAEVAQAVEELRAAEWFDFDVEAFGRMFTPAYRVTRLAACAKGMDHVWVWDVTALADGKLLQPLRALLADKNARKVAHNAKYDLLACRLDARIATEVKGFYLCTMVARSMADTETSKNQALDIANETVGMGGHKEEAEACISQCKKLLSQIATRRRNATEIKRKKLEAGEKKIHTSFDKKRAAEKKKKKPDYAKLMALSEESEEKELSALRREVMETPDEKIVEATRALFELYAMVPGDIDMGDDEQREALHKQHQQDIDIAIKGIEAGDKIEKYAFLWVPSTTLSRYNARDTYATMRLGQLVEDMLGKRKNVQRVWHRIVRPALEAMVQVEQWGVPISKDALSTLERYAKTELANTEGELKSYSDIDYGSSQQLADLLYNQLKLPVLKKTDKEQPSTDKTALKLLARETKHPILNLISRRRRLSKLLDTYVSGLWNHLTPDGKIHPWLKMDGADTGRLSCTDPNLQNIPRAGKAEKDGTWKKESIEGKMIRDVFAAFPGWALVELDYSQLELRVAAAISRDPKMIQIFKDGLDYHQRTAEMISQVAWGIPPEAVTGEHRSKAKEINFGLLYGMDDYTLSERLGCTEQEAAKLRQAILGEFHYLAEWIEKEIRLAQDTGFAYTYWWYPGQTEPSFARQRSMVDIADKDRRIRSAAARSVTNNPVQGTAADLCTDSLAKGVQWALNDCYPGQLILPIHDALMWHVPQGTEEECVYNVKRIMEDREMNGVPLVADMKMGPAWGSLVEPKKAA